MTRMMGVLVALLGLPQTPAAPPAGTTVVLVRHAETVANAGNDPDLSEAGRDRARALAEALKDADVRAVLTTQYRRTIQTGEPIAKAMNVPLVSTPIAGGAAGLDAYVRQARQDIQTKYAGGTVLIVGHSNTVPALVKAFSGAEAGDIAHDAYGDLFIVVLADAPGPGRLVRARYGPR